MIKYNDEKYNLIYYLLIFIISIISFYYSKEYALYHTDLIHWSYQLDTVINYINGGKLYKDIFLQYGEGMATSLGVVNYFYKIDIYSIGIITGTIFAIRFFFIYKLSLYLTNSKPHSIICTSIIFLSMSYTQSPWPDFYSGFFLISFLYFFVKNYEEKKFIIKILSSFLLFLTIYFRNTYLLNFIGVSILYLFLDTLFFKYKNKYINEIISFTLIITLIYLLILYFNGNLFFWFTQGFGLSDNYFAIESSSILDRLQNYLYYIARIIYQIILPKSISNFIFSICVFLNIIYLLFHEKLVKKEDDKYRPLIIFMSLYGLCGIIQTLSHYEVMRYINASISVYLVAFYFIKNFKYISEENKLYLMIISLIICVFNVKTIFPIGSHTHTINNYPKNLYNVSNFKNFGKKKFTQDVVEYYEEMKGIICDKEYIYNLSYDKALNLICDNQKNILNFNILDDEQKIISDLQGGLKKESRIVISSNKLKNLKIMYKTKFPKYFRYTFSDTYMRFIPNIIYIYE